jgi:hypothetical protein
MVFAETKNAVHKNSVGLAFQIINVTDPIANDGDGVITGVGVRFWLLEELVLRGVFYFDYRYVAITDTSTTGFGISLGAEFHFIKGIVSPYAAGFLGLEYLSTPTPGTDFHFGVGFGVELTPLDILAFFIEYSLLFTFREVGNEIDLGTNHGPTFGLIIYFN